MKTSQFTCSRIAVIRMPGRGKCAGMRRGEFSDFIGDNVTQSIHYWKWSGFLKILKIINRTSARQSSSKCMAKDSAWIISGEYLYWCPLKPSSWQLRWGILKYVSMDQWIRKTQLHAFISTGMFSAMEGRKSCCLWCSRQISFLSRH